MKKLASFALICFLFSAVNCATLSANSTVTDPLPLTDKNIFLTFDDGPTDSTTPYILDILAKEDVPATFFVIGKQINGRENILRREFYEGHSIAIHTFSHEYHKIYSSSESLLNDIEKCKKAIKSVLPDWQSNLYRFPGGSAGLREELRSAVQNTGLHFVDWNASIEDAVRPHATADDLFESAIQSAQGKDHVVLLLHDGVGYKATIACLPRLIDFFRSNGYTFKAF